MYKFQVYNMVIHNCFFFFFDSQLLKVISR